MRFDHFSIVGILLIKCKIQHFTNHWPSLANLLFIVF